MPAWGANDLDAPLAALPQGTVVCNDYGVGGWLIWRHPNVRPTIDGRVEVYATGHVKEHIDFERAAPGWQAYVRRTGCTYALLTKDQPVVEALDAAGPLDRRRSAAPSTSCSARRSDGEHAPPRDERMPSHLREVGRHTYAWRAGPMRRRSGWAQ